MNDDSEHQSILRRCGVAVGLVGLLDLCALAYCIMHGITYRSSLSIICAICGWYLYSGSLKTAGFVHWVSYFMISLMITYFLIAPVVIPVGLMATVVRNQFSATVIVVGYAIGLIGTCAWLAIKLGSQPIVTARSMQSLKPIRKLIPIGMGISLPILITSLFAWGQSSRIGQQAITLAREVQGPEYNYVLIHMSYTWNSEQSDYLATVLAWSPDEVTSVPLRWTERR